ncbi:MAG TPA: TIGR03960 family B12-binding radical SAM protein [Candidatus Limnocylindrales bacterium]
MRPAGGTPSFHNPESLPIAVVERILNRVRKPGRYAGGEWNSVQKDWSATALKWLFAYPDLYEIGMSNLGLRILYEVLNDRRDRLAERCFAPDVDFESALRSAGVPLWSIETRRPLREFDVIGLSLGFELVCSNVLTMLDLGGVGLTTAERLESDPLVIAGGSIVLNPEPYADFLDAVVLGEGEDVVLEISDTLESIGWNLRLPAEAGAAGAAGEWHRGVTRAAALRALAAIPGVYVPSFYRPRYLAGGRFDGLDRLEDAAPETITGRIASDFETTVHGIRQLVPNLAIVFDRAQIEVMRGCTRGCRFCQAGMQSRPLRERAPDVAIAAAEAILKATGYEEIGLTSLSTADYTYVREVATELHRRRPGTVLSLPSTRVDAFTVDLVDAIAPGGKRGGFTFAPEAGSQRLRDTINKGVSDEEIATTAQLAFDRGWSSVKLYFMIGLPGETMEDVLAIAAISRRVLAMGQRRHGGRAQVKANISTFVPKVMTPFQWDGQDTTLEIDAKVTALRNAMHAKGLTMSWHDATSSILEAALGRGDRRLGPVILRAWQKGARLDAWDEHFDYSRWLVAFAEEGLEPAWYAQRDIPIEEPLPWSHLGAGVSPAFLLRDRKRAQAAMATADCHWGPCGNCGVPAATGFACETGEQGPRILLTKIGDDGLGWQYVGPPGDPRRLGGVVTAAVGANVKAPAGESRGWPYDLLGSEMQAKDAGLKGLASLVDAAGGETTA